MKQELLWVSLRSSSSPARRSLGASSWPPLCLSQLHSAPTEARMKFLAKSKQRAAIDSDGSDTRRETDIGMTHWMCSYSTATIRRAFGEEEDFSNYTGNVRSTRKPEHGEMPTKDQWDVNDIKRVQLLWTEVNFAVSIWVKMYCYITNNWINRLNLDGLFWSVRRRSKVGKKRRRWFGGSEAQKGNEGFSKGTVGPCCCLMEVYWKDSCWRQWCSCPDAGVSRHSHIVSQTTWPLQPSAGRSAAALHTSTGRHHNRNVTLPPRVEGFKATDDLYCPQHSWDNREQRTHQWGYKQSQRSQPIERLIFMCQCQGSLLIG